ncbi:MAG: ABC transporter ATP-binding protein [Legionella sp.]
MPLIELKQVVKNYHIDTTTHTVLDQISLKVNQGELLAIMGASGSGKSTLMNIIGLLDKASYGQYWLQGNDVGQLNEDECATFRNQYMGFVFQQFNLLPRLNVIQNIALPLTYRPTQPKDIKAAVAEVLIKVGMSRFATYYPAQLSGGQQQRIAIARALIGQPQLLLADEPTGALDSNTGKEIMKLFLKFHNEGRTIIIVTHDETIAQQCTRQITLADGKIITELNS